MVFAVRRHDSVLLTLQSLIRNGRAIVSFVIESSKYNWNVQNQTVLFQHHHFIPCIHNVCYFKQVKRNVLNMNWTKWWVLCTNDELRKPCMLYIALSHFNARNNNNNKSLLRPKVWHPKHNGLVEWRWEKQRTNNQPTTITPTKNSSSVGEKYMSLDRSRKIRIGRGRKLFAMERVLCVAKVLLDILLDIHQISNIIFRDVVNVIFRVFFFCFDVRCAIAYLKYRKFILENCKNIIIEHGK